ncbi:hypothetical protein N431DRAFT_432617 [Stipitochalara longipes BDJ]|nr:hypothetical protein N431DRAFT_432617 [Stipitochalara longipes BDJ]
MQSLPAIALPVTALPDSQLRYQPTNAPDMPIVPQCTEQPNQYLGWLLFPRQ